MGKSRDGRQILPFVAFFSIDEKWGGEVLK